MAVKQMTHKRILFCEPGGTYVSILGTVGKLQVFNHIYRGPSEEGYICEPSTLPQCPIAMRSGKPTARLVSEPRL